MRTPGTDYGPSGTFATINGLSCKALLKVAAGVDRGDTDYRHAFHVSKNVLWSVCFMQRIQGQDGKTAAWSLCAGRRRRRSGMTSIRGLCWNGWYVNPVSREVPLREYLRKDCGLCLWSTEGLRVVAMSIGNTWSGIPVGKRHRELTLLAWTSQAK